MHRVQLSIDFLRKLSFLSAAFLLSITFTIGGETAQSKNAFFQDNQQTSVYRVSWSPDGSKIALGQGIEICDDPDSSLYSIRILNASAGQNIQTLLGSTCPIYNLDWSPDGTKIAYGGISGTVTIVPVPASTHIPPPAPAGDSSQKPFEKPSPQTPLSEGEGLKRSFLPFSLMEKGPGDEGKKTSQMASQIPATDGVRRIAWSPDGSKIAVGSGFQFCSSNPDHINTFPVDILDASTGELLKSLVGNHCYTDSVDWSPDSTKVVGTTIEPVGMRIWDVASGLVIVEGQMPVQGFIMAKWNPTNANWIAINTIGMGVAILNATTGELLNPLNLSGSSIDWSPDGTKLVVGDEYKNKVDVYDVMNSIVQFTFQGGSGFVAWSPDGSKIASGSTDGNIYVWNAISGTPLTTLSGHINIVNEVNWSPDSSKLVSASDDGTVRIWDAITGQPLEVIQGDGRIYTVDWSPDGTKIAYGGISGTVTIVPVPTSINIPPTAPAGDSSQKPFEKPSPQTPLSEGEGPGVWQSEESRCQVTAAFFVGGSGKGLKNAVRHERRRRRRCVSRRQVKWRGCWFSTQTHKRMSSAFLSSTCFRTAMSPVPIPWRSSLSTW